MSKQKYHVTIIETLQRDVEVYADNKQEAERKVKELYRNSEIVLDAGSLANTDIYLDPLNTYHSPGADADTTEQIWQKHLQNKEK